MCSVRGVVEKDMLSATRKSEVVVIVCGHGQTVGEALEEVGIEYHRIGSYPWVKPAPWEELVAMVQVSRYAAMRPVFRLKERV